MPRKAKTFFAFARCLRGHDVTLFESTPPPAFTLIELLVVIAVISLLAALLLPALARAKAQGRSAACKSHLHQLGLAQSMYLQDYGVYPWYLQNVDSATVLGWMQSLEKYYPLNWTNRSYHCPGYTGSITGTWPRTSVPCIGSYAYNGYGSASGGIENGAPESYRELGLGRILGGMPPEPVCRESEVLVPADTFSIGESRLPSGTQLQNDILTIGLVNLFGLPPNVIALRHGNTFNQLCCDGHVEGIKPLVLFDPRQTGFRWNIDHQPHPETWP
jgi:prepilin-type N-terminal cleavage/methylation domain-containing protein/prepilin-type processing-associated H-X9-DG protein